MMRASEAKVGAGLKAAALAAAGVVATQAAASEGLSGSCFAQRYDPGSLAVHPGQRVAAISVQFNDFAGALLASVVWTLRYGTTFGFSGDCEAAGDGVFNCTSCTNGHCADGAEMFTLWWRGGDRIEIVNDATGMLAGNGAGGRDYLIPLGQQNSFELTRGSAADCAWREARLP